MKAKGRAPGPSLWISNGCASSAATLRPWMSDGAGPRRRFGAGATLGVKPTETDRHNLGTNHDLAGTPENYKLFLIPGARSKGRQKLHLLLQPRQQLGNYREEVLGNDCGVVSEFADFPTHNAAHRKLRLIRLPSSLAVPAVWHVVVKPNRATLIRARSVVQVPGPPVSQFSVICHKFLVEKRLRTNLAWARPCVLPEPGIVLDQ